MLLSNSQGCFGLVLCAEITMVLFRLKEAQVVFLIKHGPVAMFLIYFIPFKYCIHVLSFICYMLIIKPCTYLAE